MPTISTTKARSNLYNLVDEVAESHTPIVITGKNNNAVLIAEKDWENIKETLYLLSIPNMGKTIKEGLNESLDDCDDTLEW